MSLLAAFEKSGRRVRMLPGEVVFRRGQQPTMIYYVLTGHVEIFSTSARGRELIVDVRSPRELLGIIGLIDNMTYTTDAIVQEEAELLQLPLPTFHQMLQADAQVTYAVLRQMVRRLRTRTEQLEDAVLLNGTSRLAKFLIGQAARQKVALQDGAVLSLDTSQRQVGLLAAGLSRETVNRELKALGQLGVISHSGKQVTVLDAARMQELVEGAPIERSRATQSKSKRKNH